MSPFKFLNLWNRNKFNIFINYEFVHIRYHILKCNYGKRYFPEDFQEPIVQPEIIEVLEKENQLEKFKCKNFLPADISRSSSVFYDSSVEKFTNLIMKGGQKSLARQLMEQTFYEIKKIQYKKYLAASSQEEKDKIILNPIIILHNAIENCKPLLTVTPVKKGAIVYQVPIPLTEKKSKWLSMKWLLEAGRDKGNDVHLPIKLSKELIDGSNYEGRVIKKKQDLHKLCEANRAYAHFVRTEKSFK